jgi:hypothetical protein
MQETQVTHPYPSPGKRCSSAGARAEAASRSLGFVENGAKVGIASSKKETRQTIGVGPDLASRADA